jgi:hypothetical protein
MGILFILESLSGIWDGPGAKANQQNSSGIPYQLLPSKIGASRA